jgi:pimeloyl-ACP methyl ester carboxylesterase
MEFFQLVFRGGRRAMSRRLTALFLLSLLVITSLPTRPAAAGRTLTPLVLIHGFGGSPETTWAGAIPILEQAGYRQGQTLFAVKLTNATGDPLALFKDAAVAREEIERIRRQTGAAQVDLVGHSQGGLIARILASGESAALVRRAVSIDAPHQGVLPDAALDAMLKEAGLPPQGRAFLPIPPHLQAGSPALRTLEAREKRFADRRSPALAIGSTWREGAPAVLDGHDGIVPLASQLAWPGAETRTFRLGPAPEVLAGIPDPFAIAWQSPHAASLADPGVLQAVIDFLAAAEVKSPSPACRCPEWSDLDGHWAQAAVAPYLPEKLPYTVAPDGRRSFEPDRAMTRAEFVYGLIRMKGLAEQLQPSPFTDVAGHWSIGYVEAARGAGLVTGIAPDQFGPDRPLTRAEAATLAARALGLSPARPGRFADTSGHWAEGYIEAAAARGIVQGDGRGFRPDDPVTNAEGALILIRAFGSGP